MGTIKDLPIYDRPREKALSYGIGVLSDAELLTIIIQCGTKNNSAIEIATSLITTANGLNNVFNLSFYELCKEKGINKNKAILILAVGELFKRFLRNNFINEKQNIELSSPLDVYNYLHFKMENLKQENQVVLYLNVKNKILYEETISIGNDTLAVNNNKLICKNAIEKYAKKILLCHNHPSGNSSPSLDDIASFFSLKSALEYLQIKLLDHIIIGQNEYYSLAREQKFQIN